MVTRRNRPRIKGTTLTQMELGEPLQANVFKMMSQECGIHKQRATFHLQVHYGIILLHASSSHPTMYNSESTQTSQWKFHIRISTQAVKQGKKQTWCIHPCCMLYTVYMYIVQQHIFHVHFQPRKLFIYMAVSLLTKMQFCSRVIQLQ